MDNLYSGLIFVILLFIGNDIFKIHNKIDKIVEKIIPPPQPNYGCLKGEFCPSYCGDIQQYNKEKREAHEKEKNEEKLRELREQQYNQ